MLVVLLVKLNYRNINIYIKKKKLYKRNNLYNFKFSLPKII